MQLRCGVMFNNDYIANLLVSLPVKIFVESWLAFGEVTDKSLVSCFFGSQCELFTAGDILSLQSVSVKPN